MSYTIRVGRGLWSSPFAIQRKVSEGEGAGNPVSHSGSETKVLQYKSKPAHSEHQRHSLQLKSPQSVLHPPCSQSFLPAAVLRG